MKDGASSAVPRLRFSEFREAGAWKTGEARYLVKVLQGYGFPERHQGQRTGEFPFYKVSDISNAAELGTGLICDAANYVDRGIVDALRASTIPAGSTIFAKIGEAIRTNRRVMTTRPSLIDNNVAGVKAIDGQSIDRFVFFLFSTMPLEKYARGVVPAINKSVIEGMQVCYPSLAEQQKIAACLTSLDEVIAAQGRKVEALKAHKLGLMQQLFPLEGETLPRFRFPQFRDAPAWEERTAGSLFANRGDRGEDGLPIYSVTMHDGMVKRSSFERRVDDIQDPAGNKKAYRNDIAYNMMRMWQGALGVAIEDCMVSPAYVVLAPQKGVVSRFFAYFFKLPTSLNLLTSHSRGLTKDRLRLYYDDFARIELRCPSEPEQQRVADCLLSIDANIAAESEKLDTLKAHKQALMQQLFPSPQGD